MWLQMHYSVYISVYFEFSYKIYRKFSQSRILYEHGGIFIWYLLSCCGRTESDALALCRRQLPEAVMKDVFVLTYDRMRRYEGAWHMERKALFPSYVILESEDGEALEEAARKYGNMVKQPECLIRLSREDEKILRRLCGENRNLEMSRGIISKGAARITDGPLKGMESRICRIDRHKRLALVGIVGESPKKKARNVPFIFAGLEIMEKTV